MVGDAARFPVRLVTLARGAVVVSEVHGVEQILQKVSGRRGGSSEAELAGVFLADAATFVGGICAGVTREHIPAL